MKASFYHHSIRGAQRLRKFVIFGQTTHEQGYSRNSSLCSAIATISTSIGKCTIAGWMPAANLGPNSKILLTILYTPIRWWFLYNRSRKLKPNDILLVPFPPHPDILLAWFLTRHSNIKIIMDALFGLYDTVVRDRSLVKKTSMVAKLIFYYEKRMMKAVDRVLVDTDQHARMLETDYSLPPGHCAAIPVGIDESLWLPVPYTQQPIFKVVFWSTFIPLHGVEVVVRAAKLLENDVNPSISILVIGNGQCGEMFRKLNNSLSPKNLTWIDRYVPIKEVIFHVSNSNCCLGIFGTGEKAGRVIPYKAYQTLSSAKALITAKTPAATDLLKDGETAILVEPGDPESLSLAIRHLSKNPLLSEKIGKNGYRLFKEKLSQKSVENALKEVLMGVIGSDKCQNGRPDPSV
jgi:glycosyltransferase involved in cell wall biosynthesis